MYIVVFNDGDSLLIPMGWDSDCDGALCCISAGPVVVFSDRAQARHAIDVSAKFAALCKAQGKPANDDFLGKFRKFVKIVPCVPEKSKETP